jgi:hypothetical protein
MKISDASRCARSVCVAALLLAGCGGSQVVEPSSTPQFIISAASRLSGGAFSASYSGKDGGHSCGTGCRVTHFRGSGTATFLRSSYERVRIRIVDGTSTGRAILKSLRSKTDSITATLSPPVYLCGSNSKSYVVTGGTGRFGHAMGSGTISTTCLSGPGYTDTWTGTLYY